MKAGPDSRGSGRRGGHVFAASGRQFGGKRRSARGGAGPTRRARTSTARAGQISRARAPGATPALHQGASASKRKADLLHPSDGGDGSHRKRARRTNSPGPLRTIYFLKLSTSVCRSREGRLSPSSTSWPVAASCPASRLVFASGFSWASRTFRLSS